MKKTLGKFLFVIVALGLVIGVQQFSGRVFGETSEPIAKAEKQEMDQKLNELLDSKTLDPQLMTHLNIIFEEEAVYENQIRAAWEMAEMNYMQKTVTEKCKENLASHKLAVRNQLLRESHVTDAKMLPLFKDLRNYLKDNNKDLQVAEIVEKHYEATKRYLILFEMSTENVQ